MNWSGTNMQPHLKIKWCYPFAFCKHERTVDLFTNDIVKKQPLILTEQ